MALTPKKKATNNHSCRLHRVWQSPEDASGNPSYLLQYFPAVTALCHEIMTVFLHISHFCRSMFLGDLRKKKRMCAVENSFLCTLFLSPATLSAWEVLT